MQTLKDKLAEARKTYEIYWDSYSKGDLETFASTLDNTFEMIGTSETEVCHTKADGIAFLQAQIEEVVGKVEMRNRQIDVVPLDQMILVNEQCDIYVLVDPDWNFYSKIRISTLLRETESGWKVIQQHGSLPDMRVQEGETLAFDKISKENLELRDAIKRRTAELENKNRELEIEAALERVRARSSAMQYADELGEVIALIFNILDEFDISVKDGVALITFNEGSKDLNEWMANPGFGSAMNFHLPYFDHPVLSNLWDAKNRGDDMLIERYSAEESRSFLNHIFEHSDFKHTPQPVKEYCLAAGTYATSIALQKHTAIFINDYSGISLTPSEVDLLKRFSAVFEQTYTRFLDLQKAEAQARESQIEASLERVRSRSMAMHKSEELTEAGELLYKELTKLGIENLTIGYVLFNENATIGYSHGVNPMTGRIRHLPVGIPHNETWVMKSIVASWKKKEPLLVLELDPKETIAHQTFIAERSSNFPISVEQLLSLSPERLKIHVFNFFQGYLLIVGGILLTESQQEMVTRFAKVFEQTYTRFLDLQKAEAQAREAQIEAALEKVRSRTMAMQSSSELGNVAAELFAQMNQLVTNLWTCGFVLCEKNRNEDEWWLSMEGDFTRGFFLPNIDDYAHASLYDGWLKGEAFRAVQLDGESLQQHYDWLMGIPVSRTIFEEMDAAGLARPDWQKLHAAYFSKGYLVLITREPCSEEEIFKRFAQVFDLTYTRFLDLKKAEAQAREAQIETALEKVRSRSLGMQKSEELKEVIQVVYEQFVHLQIHVEHAGFIMDYKVRDDMHIWLADQHEVPFQITIPYFDCAHWNSFIEAKEKGWDFFANLLGFTEKNKFYQDLFKLFPVPEEAKEYYLTCPGLAISTVLLENVGLYIENFFGTPYSDDENKILMRFGKVFQQTYTRFRDLQKAEAQTREAQIELSLEKIRALVTSMQESSDLFDIVVSMRNEFLSLGHEADYFWHMRWSPDNYEMSMTSTDGNSLGMVITVPKFVHEQIKSLHQWEKSDNPYFVLDLDAKGAWDYIEKMNTYGHFEQMDPHAPTEEDIHHLGGLTFIMARTTHGEIGFSLPGMVPDPPEEALDTLVRFAGVFDLAYKRFEDLKVAERQYRETQIELALERVRARTMAMQHSDELADASQVLDQQVRTLGIDTWGCAFHIYADNAEGDYEWFSSANGKLPFYKTPREDIFLRFYEIGQNGETFHVEEFKGEDCKVHYDYLKTIPVVGDSLKEMEESGISLPDFQIDHLAFFKYGYILFITYKPVPEAHEVFQRFAKVFEQTYTRFLDLQKLEAQTLRAEKDLIAIKAARQKAEETLSELKATQNQLVQQEKLASLGQLTAGIAHEIKNPLNFVNNFSEVSIELIEEALEEIVKTQHAESPIDQNNGLDEIIAILDDVQSNLTKIHEHGTRANNIVSSMLQHSRGGSGKKEPTDLNALIKEYVNLSYHGMRAGKNPINVEISLDLDPDLGMVSLIKEDFTRVIINLCNNAFDAMRNKTMNSNTSIETQNFAFLRGVDANPKLKNYTPILSIRTKKSGDTITIEIEDNGPGIPDDIKDKILQPFFTTKKGTEGTGLGLSITHDIIKAHGGELTVETLEGEGTTFIIDLEKKV